ncbi:MAG: hypothetical protein ABWJ42_05920 [Sulfolobales archaeon]
MALSVTRKKRDITLIMSGTLAVLFLIGILAVMEQGPPTARIYLGASPLNTGPLGVSDLYIRIKEEYPRTIIVSDWSRVTLISACSRAVLILISPEKPYTTRVLESVKKVSDNCDNFNLLIADEGNYSNKLLELFDSSIRINGSTVLSTYIYNTSGERISVRRGLNITILPVEYLLYPVASFDLEALRGENSSVVNLTLDIASLLDISKNSSVRVFGYVDRGFIMSKDRATPTSYIIVYRLNNTDLYFYEDLSFSQIPHPIHLSQNIPVAALEDKYKTKIIVFSDGSIFLNQVLRSSRGEPYYTLFKNALDFLCDRDVNCIILLDASAYNGIDPVDAINNPSLLRLVPLSQIIAMFLARILHPTTWLPPAVSWFNSFISDLLSVSFLRSLVFILLILVISLVWLRREVMMRDYSYKEIVYRDILHFRDLVESIRSGRYRIDKRDFISLYDLIEEIFNTYLDTSLRSPWLADYLSNQYNIDRERVVRYQRFMNKYYDKAGRRGLAKITSFALWSRVFKKALNESLKLLRDIGSGLEKKFSEV